MLGNDGSREIFGLIAMTEDVLGCVHTIAVLRNELRLSERRKRRPTHKPVVYMELAELVEDGPRCR